MVPNGLPGDGATMTASDAPVDGGPRGAQGATGDQPSTVKVRIRGDVYTVRGPGTPEHIQRLASELDRRLGAVVRRNPRLALHQAAVLCALEILDELAKAKEQLASRADGHPAARRAGRREP